MFENLRISPRESHQLGHYTELPNGCHRWLVRVPNFYRRLRTGAVKEKGHEDITDEGYEKSRRATQG